MFEVLAYVFEVFNDPDACADRDALARQLTAAGFEDEEIDDALNWLDALDNDAQGAYARIDEAHGMRIYAEREQERLPTEVRGLLQFLEDHEALSPAQREIVVDRLLALSSDEINLPSAKLVALMVLWTQKTELPLLVGEALMDAVHGEPTMQ
ncbi:MULTISPECIES: DUF494 family protein [Gulbenkiania]|uniref:Protein Smg homolog n=2 Tax=Gulbenkiania TaxID=397456 RepID=A0A0K6GY80_9NEIS|nr:MULTISPECIES: DUF494 domain-containing protein [Gulbenkiania]TCW32772.1 Smg protein [Gulbenkiania mobilis]CUA83697.1 Uncharacterized conserved protein Smg, DUF494 family [Gulbenkiania indica]